MHYRNTVMNWKRRSRFNIGILSGLLHQSPIRIFKKMCKRWKISNFQVKEENILTIHLFIWFTSQYKNTYALQYKAFFRVFGVYSFNSVNTHKGRVNAQLGFGPNYLGTDRFSYPMVIDTRTNHKYIVQSDLNPITFNMKLHKTVSGLH